MMVTPAEEEVETEVRREDQNNINKFARLNARLHELREERKIVKVGVCFNSVFLEWRRKENSF
jgi:hypothetical protein